MRVKVRFVGLMRRYIGSADEELELPDGAGVEELLRMLGSRYAEKLPPGLWREEEGSFHHSVKAARSGEKFLSEKERLRDGDEIYLVFRMAGG
jgi:molybdopterin converting factor small subunit